jgi:predicted acetyltransferase
MDDEEVNEAGEIASKAFARASWASAGYFKLLGRENHRVLREKGTVVATLGVLPLGQWFGGRCVPMAGIGTVAVGPEFWGQRLGSRLMHEAVREMARNGFAISTLFPATWTLYRAAGYEPAGGSYEVEISASAIGVAERDLPLRPITASDEEGIEEAYRAHATHAPGHLDRSPFYWRFLRNRPDATVDGYLVEADGRIEGYVYTVARPSPGSYPIDLELADIVALTPRAGRRLLTFLFDHRAQIRNVRWRSSPDDPLLVLLPEHTFRLRMNEHWMLRMANVPAALSGRGYPPGLRAELHLEVRDETVPENRGRFVLQVADGEGTVEPGGDGRLRMDVRGLAPLYTGHLSPFALARAGLVEGTAADLAAAGGIFAGPPPWHPDHF